MPFQKGNKLGQGRKSRKIEIEQEIRMNKLLSGMLDLAEKIKKGKATKKDLDTFNTLQKLNLKVMDKLHANRQYTELKSTQPITLNVVRFKE